VIVHFLETGKLPKEEDMKYIASYAPTAPSVSDAKIRHEEEFYREPHNVSNGHVMGVYVQTPEVLKKFENEYSSEEKEMEEQWENWVVFALISHLRENTSFTSPQDEINGFRQCNNGFLLKIGAGYTAYISQDGKHLLAESYVACSGNTVVVIHYGDRSVLCVNSRRHGIPELACSFIDEQAWEVVMYDSFRTDKSWHESGLASNHHNAD
jgi:hypothetical protein